MGNRPGSLDADETADDRELAARARHDRAAFAPLYLRYVDPVYRYCYARLGEKTSAEDLTAEVFARALAGIGGYRGDRPFRSWLFAVAHNTVANAHRARARRPEDPLPEAEVGVDPAPLPDEVAESTETRLEVLALLARLPADQRRILELRLAGLTGAEIAEALGRSPGAVKIAQVRAYARLRDLLGIERSPARVEEHARGAR